MWRTLLTFGVLVGIACGDEDHGGDTLETSDADALEIEEAVLDSGQAETAAELDSVQAESDAAPEIEADVAPEARDAEDSEDSDDIEAADDADDHADEAMPDVSDVLADTAPPRAHGLESRVINTTCALAGTPPLGILPLDIVPAFVDLTVADAIGLVQIPGAGKLAAVERAGRIRAFVGAGTGADVTTVLDISDRVDAATGLLAAAFRPDALFVSYVAADDPVRLVLAAYPIGADGRADGAEGTELLAVPLASAERAGGALVFLFDGTLVLALGDGGDGEAAADDLSPLGKALRLDVSDAPASGYGVPADNPHLDDPAFLPEIFATGFALPTSCSVDRIVGRVWCADAGGATRDRIMVILRGVAATLRSQPRGACGVIAGAVSRDASLLDNQGAFLYGERCATQVAALRFDGSHVVAQGAVATLPPLAALGEDEAGHLYAIDEAGALHGFAHKAGTPPPAFPATLSATGCLRSTPDHIAVPALIPFEVRTPLWSDGAHKRRFIILPGQETIGFTLTGSWQLPVGTLLMKEFRLDDDAEDATPTLIMETRFLVKQDAARWEGYSYMWDRERREAFLLDGGETQSYPMAEGAVDASGASVHLHTFPSRNQCLLCHNPAAGSTLGLQTGRMNTDHDYDGFVENQLAAMDHVGLFSEPLPAAPDALPRFVEPNDEGASLDARARSWLYANCAHCHVPLGPTPVDLDFRVETSLAATRACGVSPRFVLAQIPDAKIITPGDADHSELFFRLARRDRNQMPPIATLIIDPDGTELVRAWIDSLTSCE